MIRRMGTTDRILFGILIWCIFSFKLVIIGVGESGVRADDILTIVAILLLLFRGDLHRIKRSPALNVYLGFIGVGLVSALWNSAAGRVDLALSLFFVARLLQYLTFYYLGYLFARKESALSRVFTIYMAVLCVIVPLQMIGLFPVLGGFAGITSRAVGNTNGPYELAMVGAFLMCYLGYYYRRRFSGCLSFFLVLLSASRVTFVATTFSVLKVMVVRTKSRHARLAAVAAVAAVLVVAGFLIVRSVGSEESSAQSSGVFGRLSTAAGSGVSLDLLSAAYDNAPVYQTSRDYFNGVFVTAVNEAHLANSDTSELERLFRWATLIKSTLSGSGTVVFGLGPSFGTAAVDGYFVRLFIETGMLGLLLFGSFAWTILFRDGSASLPFREYVFIMLATGCFIDIFVSYKSMLLLWLWHGMCRYRYELRLRQLSLAGTDAKPAWPKRNLPQTQEST